LVEVVKPCAALELHEGAGRDGVVRPLLPERLQLRRDVQPAPLELALLGQAAGRSRCPDRRGGRRERHREVVELREELRSRSVDPGSMVKVTVCDEARCDLFTARTPSDHPGWSSSRLSRVRGPPRAVNTSVDGDGRVQVPNVVGENDGRGEFTASGCENENV